MVPVSKIAIVTCVDVSVRKRQGDSMKVKEGFFFARAETLTVEEDFLVIAQVVTL